MDFSVRMPPLPMYTLFPYTTLFRSNAFWLLPHGVPTQLVPLVVESNERPLRSPIGVTLIQAEDGIRLAAVTGVQTCALPIPNPLRPVGVTTGVIVMPLAINVPPLPSEMPCRISQVAPVTVVQARSSEKPSVTLHPGPCTSKSS